MPVTVQRAKAPQRGRQPGVWVLDVQRGGACTGKPGGGQKGGGPGTEQRFPGRPCRTFREALGVGIVTSDAVMEAHPLYTWT